MTIVKNRNLLPSLALANTLGLAALSCAFFSTPAEAATVSVNNVAYDLTTFFGSYHENSSRFSTTEMPWFGSFSSTTAFAKALGGHPWGGLASNGFIGPMFAFGIDSNSLRTLATEANGFLSFTGSLSQTRRVNYAIATPASISLESDVVNVLNNFDFDGLFSVEITDSVTAVPEPLTLLGAGTAIAFGVGFKRKR